MEWCSSSTKRQFHQIAEKMAPEGQAQMADRSPWAALATDAVLLDREYWNHSFSPQTRNKQYCETTETSEKTKMFVTTHTVM